MATKCKQICKIDYSNQIAEQVGTGAALLVGMLRGWVRVMKREIWKSNDEIMQELGMTRYQFSQARAAIGTRIYAGDSKKELQRVRDDEGKLAPISRVILYWKDRANRMWYWVNEELFAEYASIPYGLQNDRQTIGNVEAEGRDLQTIDTEQATIQAKEEKAFFQEEKKSAFAAEKREQLPEQDAEWRYVARMAAIPAGVALARKDGASWVVQSPWEHFPQMRALAQYARQNFGVSVTFEKKSAGVPIWAGS